MCGIVGVLDPRRRRLAPDFSELLGRMAEPMTARGPDGSGTWVDDGLGVGFGHRRLAIIDLSEHGAQPMASADGRFVLTYNGEIYNHAELAAELDATGMRRRGHSDTEILLEGIARWGLLETLDRVDGMFAFGLWDRSANTLTLARDRMGEKPLHYGTLGSGEVVFASSLDALRAHPAFDRPVDHDALALYFRHKYVPAPWTIYAGIHKLEPGTVVRISADGSIGRPEPYWSYLDLVDHGPTFSGDERDAVDELERLLHRSCARRLVADVPVGAFLSGGVDSSTVVAAAQQVSHTPVRTFTIGSTDADYDESEDARRVARHLGTEHHELMVTDDDARAVVDGLGAMYDEPFGDSSQIPTWLVSRMAREHVTVALSGDAGDELFGGYNRYTWLPAIWDRVGRAPSRMRTMTAGALGSVPPVVWDRAAGVLPKRRRPRMVGLKTGKVLDMARSTDAEAAYLRLVTHWPDPQRLVPGSHEPPTLHTDPDRWPRTPGIVEHMMAIDAVTYLPDDVLAKVDRAAMAVSLETRIPLLDRSIVELAASLPTSMKLRDGTSKWLLREVFDRSVPRELIDRPKSGFGVPIETWLRGPLRPWAEDLVFGPEVSTVLDRTTLTRAWDAHQRGRRNLGYELWDVVMFAAWCRERSIEP